MSKKYPFPLKKKLYSWYERTFKITQGHQSMSFYLSYNFNNKCLPSILFEKNMVKLLSDSSYTRSDKKISELFELLGNGAS